jgi:prevent-host-death family protein
MKISQDIRTITELKAQAARLLDQVNAEKRPVIITQDGKPRAVMMDVVSYESLRDALGLLTLVAQGEEDIRAGRVLKHAEVVRRLERKYGRRRRRGRRAI